MGWMGTQMSTSRSKSTTSKKRVSRNASVYLRKRDRLLAFLGDTCERCGTHKRREFHHKHGRDWALERVASHRRLKIIEEEIKQNLIGILCRRCNAKVGNPRRSNAPEGVDPF